VNALSGKTVLVTGAARRLGKAIALAMADAGAQVAITYRTSSTEAEETLAQIKARSAKALAVACDVRQEPSVAAAVSTVLKEFGRVDVLVNNAGTFVSSKFEDITLEQWDNVFATNVRGPFLMSKHCVPALRRAKGKIIHLGSLGGERPWPTHAHYCSSKAALHMLTQVMARALAPDIAVNCVAPGTIDAGDAKEDPAFMERVAARTPMGRTGTVEEIAGAVMYFATTSHFITGQIMNVDGGLSLT
jgi:NAD(P)-dependent dehydrogenase (short-subunit alcohol dehydrogenase family)